MRTLITANPGVVTITITGETEAWDLAHFFPLSDGFHHDLASAICEAWPDEPGDPAEVEVSSSTEGGAVGGAAAIRRWAVTFGLKYRCEPHPTLPEAHSEGFAVVHAPDIDAAFTHAHAVIGREFSHIYPFETDEDRAEMDRFFPRGPVVDLGTYGGDDGSSEVSR